MVYLVTNGCSGVPDFRFTDCCNAHDIAYATHCLPDGTPCTREQADELLRCCISGKGSPLWAEVVFAGVRLLGGGFWEELKPMSQRGEDTQAP